MKLETVLNQPLRARVQRLGESLRRWSRDEEGLQAVEWVLVLAGGVFPLSLIVFQVMKAVAFYYELASWVVALPFP